jgi:hypothetical protein
VGELKGKMEKFCQYYTSTAKGNATLAAKMAGYSARTAYKIGSENIRKPQISARIRELNLEALHESGYDPALVRRLLVGRLTAIVSADLTDVVHISPGLDDPNRAAALDALAAANGGQREIDFGETIIAPTTSLPAYVKAAIKRISPVLTPKGRMVGLDVEMHDPIAAAGTLARIEGIGGASEMNVNVDIGEMLDAARKRISDGKPPVTASDGSTDTNSGGARNADLRRASPTAIGGEDDAVSLPVLSATGKDFEAWLTE